MLQSPRGAAIHTACVATQDRRFLPSHKPSLLAGDLLEPATAPFQPICLILGMETWHRREGVRPGRVLAQSWEALPGCLVQIQPTASKQAWKLTGNPRVKSPRDLNKGYCAFRQTCTKTQILASFLKHISAFNPPINFLLPPLRVRAELQFHTLRM